MKRKRITSMGENSSTVRYECRGSCAGSHKPYANEKNWINHFDIYLNQRETVDKTADYFQSAYAEAPTYYPKFLRNCKMCLGKTFSS